MRLIFEHHLRSFQTMPSKWLKLSVLFFFSVFYLSAIQDSIVIKICQILVPYYISSHFWSTLVNIQNIFYSPPFKRLLQLSCNLNFKLVQLYPLPFHSNNLTLLVNILFSYKSRHSSFSNEVDSSKVTIVLISTKSVCWKLI